MPLPTSHSAARHLSSSAAGRVVHDDHTPPPHTLHGAAPDGATFEGDAPDVFSGRLLHPSARPELDGKRGNSWRDILTGSGDEGERQEEEGEGEDDPLVPPSSPTGNGAGGRKTPKRDRSASWHRRRSELPWWKRPSPLWFMPGTLAIALSMGMTIAPKLSIYTTLICRAMPTERSGVTVPPPILATDPTSHPHTNTSFWSPDLAPQSFDRAAVVFEWVSTPVSAASGETAPVTFKRLDESVKVPEDPAEQERRDKELEREWNHQCAKSSAVQSEVASLALILSLLMGILSSMTTGFWGSLSDRRGRKPVLVLALLGTVLMDSVFLLTVNYHQILSYNFLFLGPLLDGLLGGYTTAQATSTAYLSDVTSSGSRAQIFSLLGGIMYGGVALGPLVGSFLISSTGGNQLAPFYASLVLHSGYFVVALVLLPESLEKERQYDARARHAQEKERERERRADEAEKARASGHRGAYVVHRAGELFARPFAFLKPVALLLPGAPTAPRVAGEEGAEEDEDARPNIEWGADLEEYHHPEDVWEGKHDGEGEEGSEKRSRRNWALTFVAGSWTAYMMLVAVLQTKLQYANLSFSWTSLEDGYFLSFLGLSRVLTMVVILPLFIRRVLGRREAPLPTWPKPDLGDAAVEGEGEGEEAEKAQRWERERKWLKTVHESHFDLLLALCSLTLDLAAFVLYTLAPRLPPHTPRSHMSLFLLSAFLQSLGSGATPALQSLALAHASPRDAGRLFASLSVLQSLAAQVVGPLVFGVTFMRTVGRWSEAIFALATGLAAVSLAALGGVRLRRVWVAPRDGEGEGEGAKVGAGGAGRPGLGGRGRSETRREVRPAESGISLRTQAEEVE
ncbi:hypothetical protein JCM6882_008691 [Rhodosporidiobolus microsporus]